MKRNRSPKPLTGKFAIGAGAHGAAAPNGAGQRPRGLRSAMGEFTVAQEDEGWIVLEDGSASVVRCVIPLPVEKRLSGILSASWRTKQS